MKKSILEYPPHRFRPEDLLTFVEFPHHMNLDILKEKSVGELIAEGFEEFADALKSDKKTVAEKFTCHKVSLDLSPTPYSPARVKAARKLLAASQAVFAQFLGVSVKTVRAWEQGVNTPRESACRLMDEIHHDPEYWRTRLRELAVKKTRKARNRKVRS
jgi:putative transcriptional regulator